MTTAAGGEVGFRVPCPLCGVLGGLVVNVHNLSIDCTECAEPVTREDLQRFIDDVRRLLLWLDAPPRD